MSETNTQTSLLVINSVAERLKAAGFRQTGVAAAVAEFVQECLGFHAKLSPNLMRALGESKSAVGVVLGATEAIHDPKFEQTKTGTHG